MGTYKDLDIYLIAMELFFKVHPLTLKLPRYELYELGSQLRGSSNSVVSNIVEGYGRRRYKNDYIKFLVYAHASNEETINHLDKLAFLYPDLSHGFLELLEKYNSLGRKINNFIKIVEKTR
jgi:four helix bundle protein